LCWYLQSHELKGLKALFFFKTSRPAQNFSKFRNKEKKKNDFPFLGFLSAGLLVSPYLLTFICWFCAGFVLVLCWFCAGFRIFYYF
jgi:hypothetical protein